MPELPEVESARRVLVHALDREIAEVDDHDEWVCRPHPPGAIAAALKGGRLTAAHRLGKALWCDTATAAGPGPALGIHLGTGGRLRLSGHGGEYSGGDYVPSAAQPDWVRFAIVFADGGRLRLFDSRRFARVQLDPPLDALGPDAGEITVTQFRERVGRSRAPVKARLLDQSVLAGVGNLLADESLWRAAIDPRARADELGRHALDRLYRCLREALRDAVARGGVHTGVLVEHRRPGGRCPRCGAELLRGRVGGRTTWWCPAEQR